MIILSIISYVVFIFNKKIVIQTFRPRATPSRLSASLRRAVWESPVLKSKRPEAVTASWGSTTFWASVSPTVIGGYWLLHRNRKLDSSCMGEKKGSPLKSRLWTFIYFCVCACVCMRTRLSVSVCMRGKKAYLSESEDWPGKDMK